jgi:hypothetical protein
MRRPELSAAPFVSACLDVFTMYFSAYVLKINVEVLIATYGCFIFNFYFLITTYTRSLRALNNAYISLLTVFNFLVFERLKLLLNFVLQFKNKVFDKCVAFSTSSKRPLIIELFLQLNLY